MSASRVVPAPRSTRCPICAKVAARSGHALGGHDIYLCDVCTLRFAPGAWDVEVDYNAIYDSPEYQEAQVLALERGAGVEETIKHPTYAPFFQRMRHRGGARLLDVGCGVGRFAHA